MWESDLPYEEIQRLVQKYGQGYIISLAGLSSVINPCKFAEIPCKHEGCEDFPLLNQPLSDIHIQLSY